MIDVIFQNNKMYIESLYFVLGIDDTHMSPPRYRTLSIPIKDEDSSSIKQHHFNLQIVDQHSSARGGYCIVSSHYIYQ